MSTKIGSYYMNIPTFPNIDRGLNFLNSKIMQAKTDWEKYGYATSGAYAWAWHHQDEKLKKVSENIKKRLEAEEAIATFALNLLTVGIGGAVAGACVKKFLDPATQKELVDKAVDWAKEKVKEPIKKSTEWAYKHLGATSSEDAFKPPGVSPDEYSATLLEGIMSRTKVLADMMVEVQSDPSGVTLQGVQHLAQVICNSNFVDQLPPNVDQHTLKPKALLGLWLMWAWQRDVRYWEKHSISASMFLGEQQDFEPVRLDLIRTVGIPEAQISQGVTVIAPGIYRNLNVINMDAFIKWSRSVDALNMLFKGAALTPDMQKQVQIQWMMKRSMPAWMSVSVDD